MSWTPEAIAAEMRATVIQMERAPRIVSDAREAHLAAKTLLTKAKAAMRISFLPGTYNDRDDRATMDEGIHDLAVALDVADAAHAHARDVAAMLEKKLSALQSEARLIALDYNTGGSRNG